MEARLIYKIHSSPHVSDLLSTAMGIFGVIPVLKLVGAQVGQLWPGWGGTSLDQCVAISACHTQNRDFLPFRDEIFVTWDWQGWGSWDAVVWKNPLQAQAFGSRILESLQLCRTGLMLWVWTDFKGKMVKLHICMTRWSVWHHSPICHLYFVVL